MVVPNNFHVIYTSSKAAPGLSYESFAHKKGIKSSTHINENADKNANSGIKDTSNPTPKGLKISKNALEYFGLRQTKPFRGEDVGDWES